MQRNGETDVQVLLEIIGIERQMYTLMSWERMSRSKMHERLGFRQLHDFNIALLGKQGWRLVVNQDSLVAIISKAHYYPNQSFLNAKLGSGPSYVLKCVDSLIVNQTWHGM